MAIDIIDEKLLEVLQENARISISELSKKINLSLSAVSERLKKLESSGIIEQYTAILNPAEMNKNMMIIMQVAVSGAGKAEFEKLILAEPDVIACTRITGDYDYIIKIASENQSSVQLIVDKIKTVRGISRVHTDLLLDDVKTGYSVRPAANK